MKTIKLILVKIADLFLLNTVERKLLFLYENQNQWKGNENFSNAVNHISSIVVSINEQRDKLSSNHQTFDENLKYNQKKQLAATASRIAKQAKVYAMHLNDSDMKEKLNISYSEILRLSDHQLVSRINQILHTLEPIINLLTLYGVTNDDLDELCSELSTYSAINSCYSISDSEKGKIKNEVSKLTDKLKSEIKNIEERIKGFKNPKLVSEFTVTN